MRGAVLYGPRDVRFEEREVPKIINPTDAVIRISSACVCGSDLWPYRGIQPIAQPTPMGHEYCGITSHPARTASSSAVHRPPFCASRLQTAPWSRHLTFLRRT